MSAASPRGQHRDPNSVMVCVKDATGRIYCHSYSDLRYEAAAIKHARWWMRQRRIGDACRPLTLVVERYFDETATCHHTTCRPDFCHDYPDCPRAAA